MIRTDRKIDAVVVLSGGQDSALCLALACRRFVVGGEGLGPPTLTV